MERELVDQAYSLRKSMWEKGHKAIYISVSSGKGGVGKTTFSINFSCLLARTGKKVLLFDADLGLANIDIMLKVSPKANIKDYIDGRVALEDVLIKDVYGFDLFPASSGFVEMADPTDSNFNKIRDVMVKLDTNYDYIIFDTGAGIANNVHRFAALADYVVVVSQPEPTAIADCYAFLKTAQQLYELKTAYLVFNKIDDVPASRKVYQNLRDVVHKFLGMELIFVASLAEDPAARRAQRGQKPLCVLEYDSPFIEGIRGVVDKVDRLWPRKRD